MMMTSLQSADTLPEVHILEKRVLLEAAAADTRKHMEAEKLKQQGACSSASEISLG